MHPDDGVQVDAMGSAREVKDDRIPSVGLNPTTAPAKTATTVETLQHTRRLRGCHERPELVWRNASPGETQPASC